MRGFYLPLLAAIGSSGPTFAALAPAATSLSYVISPPVADGGKAWKDAHAQAAELVAEMTLEEKVSYNPILRWVCQAKLILHNR